jgi:peptidyl-prolyl cis-trans isomerase A (cyclophilin A)
MMRLALTLAMLAVLSLEAGAAEPPRERTTAPAPVTVTLETSLGSIDIEVYPAQAPLSAGDFLRYVDQGLYTGAGFYRVVRRDNDHGKPVIEVVQGGLLDESKALPPVAHEPTRDTGLRHEDGTISLARGAAGTGGGAAFFICIGPQPALDFGAKRNPDGLGFAAFGRVVRGMDVIRRIHGLPATGKADSDYVRGQILASPVMITRVTRRQ